MIGTSEVISELAAALYPWLRRRLGIALSGTGCLFVGVGGLITMLESNPAPERQVR